MAYSKMKYTLDEIADTVVDLALEKLAEKAFRVIIEEPYEFTPEGQVKSTVVKKLKVRLDSGA